MNSLFHWQAWLPGLLLICCLTAAQHATATPYQSIREIPVVNLPDIAVASIDQHGPVIYYNPILAEMVGPWVTEFFRAHEVFHHRLGHLLDRDALADPEQRIAMEKRADCEAAKVISPYAVLAAVEFFIATQGPTRVDPLHPTGYERAETVRLCGGDR